MNTVAAKRAYFSTARDEDMSSRGCLLNSIPDLLTADHQTRAFFESADVLLLYKGWNHPAPAVLGVKGHRRVEGRARACKEIEDGGVLINVRL